MNILYHTYIKLNPTSGGTERTTLTIAHELRQLYNAHIYSIYEAPATTPKPDCIDDEFLWTIDRDEDKNAHILRTIIEQWKIDVVIVQGAFIHVKRFRKAIYGLDCKLIFAHHFAPGWEVDAGSFLRHIRHMPKDGVKNFIRWARKAILYRHYKNVEIQSLKSNYLSAYRNADNVVLLSNRFTEEFKAFGEIHDNEKFRYIPNALTLEEFATPQDLASKGKKVIIVARLDEASKRISLALEIWRQVKLDSRSRGWTLDIVGHGIDEAMYKRIVKKKKITDVNFLGRKNPVEDYRNASIFMMTSCKESWGLTLTEAQQMGVVPIAFNTYPTLTEILTNGEDSVVVESDNLSQYVENVLTLMAEKSLRQRLALNGQRNCRRFDSKNIAKIWWNLIND